MQRASAFGICKQFSGSYCLADFELLGTQGSCSLLRSQFETLETPGDALFADIAQPVETIVADLAARLRLDAPQSNG